MYTKKFKVYGIGNAITDLQLQIAEEVFKPLGLIKGEMRLVKADQQQKLLERFDLKTIHQASGGSVANSLISLAQLGAPVAFSGLVGKDKFGLDYIEEMAKLGIALHTDPVSNLATGTCLVLITPDAERTMNTYLGATELFDENNVSEEFIKQAEWLYIEGYLFSTENGQRAIKKAISLAKHFGTKVAITFSDGFIVDCFGSPLKQAVDQADLIFANLNEGRKFTGEDDPKKVFSKLKEACVNVALTMSDQGSWVCYYGEDSKIEPFMTKAVDDTGAGDMYSGVFLYGVSHGMNGRDSGRLASFFASRVVSKLGPRLEGDLKLLANTAGVDFA